MTNRNAFIGDNWKITAVNGLLEVIGDKISISRTGGTFRVTCPGHKDYPDANYENGKLNAVDGSYTIELTSPGPTKVIDYHPRPIGITPGSWTAEDNSGTGGAAEA